MKKAVWTHVKATVRTIEKDDGVLIFDDTIQEKEWTDEFARHQDAANETRQLGHKER